MRLVIVKLRLKNEEAMWWRLLCVSILERLRERGWLKMKQVNVNGVY
jgi:hypothetical protein